MLKVEKMNNAGKIWDGKNQVRFELEFGRKMSFSAERGLEFSMMELEIRLWIILRRFFGCFLNRKILQKSD
jgi:hypothetical protein